MANIISFGGINWSVNEKTKQIISEDKSIKAGINDAGVNYFGSIVEGVGMYYQYNFDWCEGLRGECFKKVNELFK